MQARHFRDVLIGRSLARSGQALITAIVLMVGFYLLLSHTGSLGESINHWLSRNYNVVLVIITLLAGSLIVSFYNNGVAISIAIVGIPLAGFFLSGNIAYVREPTFISRVTYTMQGMLLYGAPIGLIGYFLGRILNKMSASTTP